MARIALGRLALLVLAALLVACSPNMSGRNLLEDRLSSKPNDPSLNDKQRKLDKYLARNEVGSNSTSQSFDGISRFGNDQLVGKPLRSDASAFDRGEGEVTLNLVAVPIPQAAKSVMGDMLGLQYTVDSRVSGTLTLQTPKPVSRELLLNLFQAALRDNGAAIAVSGEAYRIIPLADATKAGSPVRVSGGDLDKPGVAPEIITLRYVAAENIRQVIEPMVPPGMIVRADSDRNAIILSGTAREVAAIRETISVFDVDWMRGMSIALVPVRSSSPEAIVGDLEQLFQTRNGPLRGMVRFVPNARLRSVLVISSKSKYVKEAKNWIRKIDVLAESGEISLHVYHVQNRNAGELAKILAAIVGRSAQSRQSSSAASAETNGGVAPKFNPVISSSSGEAQDGSGQLITGGPETPAGGIDSAAKEELQAALDAPMGDSQDTLKIVADDANNSLLIYSTSQQFERMKSVLSQIDTVPNQVLLEAVIAEVSLDDDLKFGVRWFFGEDNNHGTFSDAANGAVSSVFPGFSYFLKANDIGFTLNALSSVTDVRVLSAPSLVVLDNRTATLQVGDQVPIVTQSAKAVTAGDAPIVTNVELKDTGLILKVVPRVNDSGLVTLDIQQEVSTVVKTTSSGIDSPTIRQRKLNTSVVVSNGEALALGGLIQERESTGKTKVPVLGDVPLFGNAFRQKTNAVSRTELLIFIRPRVIRDLEEARIVTEQFRQQLSVEAPLVRTTEPTPGQELWRILN